MQGQGYCERLDGSFWAEPLNAVTNAAFLLAAIAAFRLWRRADGRDGSTLALIAAVFAIGVGSFLFHTMPRRWTLLADVVPIQLFAFSYFGLALARFLGLRPALAAAGTVAFIVVALVLQAGIAPLLPQGLRGSAGYGAFLLGLLGVAAALAGRPGARETARRLALAGLVFALSLSFRTLDLPLCAGFALGTHWLWHLLNAVVLHLLLRAAILHQPVRPSSNGGARG